MGNEDWIKFDHHDVDAKGKPIESKRNIKPKEQPAPKPKDAHPA
jgi:hypothetical protein